MKDGKVELRVLVQGGQFLVVAIHLLHMEGDKVLPLLSIIVGAVLKNMKKKRKKVNQNLILMKIIEKKI